VKLNVLFVTPRYFPSVGGTEIHTWEVARRLVVRGFDCTILTIAQGEDVASREMIDGVNVVRIGAWPPNSDLFFAPAIAREVRSVQPDILHLQGIHTLVPPVALLAARAASIPYVVSFHSGGHSSRIRRLVRPAMWRTMRPLLTGAERLIAVSEFERDLFSRLLRLPKSRFIVIPSGIDLPQRPPGPVDVDVPIIVSIGRLERYKGHHRIIRALPVIARRVPNVRLRIVGAGPYEGRLRKLIRSLGLEDRVDIAGVPFSRRKELVDVYRRAAVITVLSEYESQGIAAMEAIGLNRPVVVESKAALGDLARQGIARRLPALATKNDIADVVVAEIVSPCVPRDTPLPRWNETVEALQREYKAILSK